MRASALAVVAAIAAAPVPPAPTRWVEDHAAFLSPATRGALDARLEAYDRATGHQVIVWIGRSLDGAPLDDWAASTFAAWKIGRKGIDDGVAVFILADDRAIDIEVGYGLEDRVPDAIASRIIRDVMAPRLRAGDRDGAVTSGVDALLGAIEGKPWAGPPPAVAPSLPLWEWIAIAIGVVLALAFAITHPRLALWMLATTLGRGGGSSRGGRGGFSGGGGRSGGGGARGSW
ncbi:MAG TPA: TPM domain-containing protein [Kofleriaceae bacterium]|nr:TPM domain-containing protein [Kofleriaceae bacterium]